MRRLLVGLALAITVGLVPMWAQAQRGGQAPVPPRPWMDKTLSPDARADFVIAELTIDEKIGLVHGFGRGGGGTTPDPAVAVTAARSNGGAGFAPGIPRLGIPDLQLADAAVGIARAAARGRYATALPSTVAPTHPC